MEGQRKTIDHIGRSKGISTSLQTFFADWLVSKEEQQEIEKVLLGRLARGDDEPPLSNAQLLGRPQEQTPSGDESKIAASRHQPERAHKESLSTWR